MNATFNPAKVVERNEEISMKNLSVDVPVTSDIQSEYYQKTDYRVTLPPRNK